MHPEDFTIRQIKEFQKSLKKLKTITEWKIAVKKFAVEYGLTDIQAIEVARGTLALVDDKWCNTNKHSLRRGNRLWLVHSYRKQR